MKVPDVRRLTRLPFPYRQAPTPNGMQPLPPKRRTGVDYETDWARSFGVRMARFAVLEGLISPSMSLLAAPRVRGLDRLHDLRQLDPPQPVIFVSNHHSHVDTPLLLSTIPEPWRYRMFVAAAADYFFKTRATSALSAFALNAIPLERTKVSRRTADDAAVLLDDGWSMLIFPEGGRSPDGWGQPFRGGAAYLSLRCGVPVAPIHLEGTGRILRKGAKAPKRSATSITFGAPLRPDEGEDARRFGARLERAVAALADESTTDWYSARRRTHEGSTPTLGGPDAPSWRRQWALGDRGPKRHRPKTKTWPDLG